MWHLTSNPYFRTFPYFTIRTDVIKPRKAVNALLYQADCVKLYREQIAEQMSIEEIFRFEINYSFFSL
jgi:hypothetical protein